MSNKLVLSILSARNKQTGQYRLLADSNMHSMLNRLLHMGEKDCTIGLPCAEQIEDLAPFAELLDKLGFCYELGFPYGSRILETRLSFERKFLGRCFATSICGVRARHYMANTFITPGINQPCDMFANADLFSMRFAERIYVYNEHMLCYMPGWARAKTIIDTNVCHKAYYEAIGSEPLHFLTIGEADLVVPINIGDPEYNLEPLFDWQGRVLLLNPRRAPLSKLADLHNKLELPLLSKPQFYWLLQNSRAIFYPSITEIFHVLGAELAYFGFKHWQNGLYLSPREKLV